MSLLSLLLGCRGRSSRPRAAAADAVPNRWAFRPNLESLEERLPPGDLLGTALANLSRFVDLGDASSVQLINPRPTSTPAFTPPAPPVVVPLPAVPAFVPPQPAAVHAVPPAAPALASLADSPYADLFAGLGVPQQQPGGGVRTVALLSPPVAGGGGASTFGVAPSLNSAAAGPVGGVSTTDKAGSDGGTAGNNGSGISFPPGGTGTGTGNGQGSGTNGGGNGTGSGLGGPGGPGPVSGVGSGTDGGGSTSKTPTKLPFPKEQPGNVQAPALKANPYDGMFGSSALSDLSDGYAIAKLDGKTPQFLAAQSQEFVFNASGNVLVNVRARVGGDLKALQKDLVNLVDMQVTGVTPAQGLVTGYVPIANLFDVTAATDFGAITPVYAPIFSAGSVMTEGDAVIGANTFRQSTGMTGAGITVGVLSNTLSQVGAGYASAQATGDLPAVNVLQDGSSIGATDEGRGMLEVIHDVAPGASLAFNTAEGGPQAFAQGITNLATAGHANVITDDAIYPNEPFFNEGVVSQAIDNVTVNRNVMYLTAAGNLASNAWQDSFRPVTTSVGGVFGQFENFNASGKANALQQFVLPVGQTISLSFQWDSAYLEGGSPLAQYQVQNSLSVLLTDATGNKLIHQYADVNQNTGEALQRVVFTNDGSYGTNVFSLAFHLDSGPAPTLLKWIRFDNNTPAQYQGAGTIFGHQADPNALTVGAVNWATPRVAEPYSSRGPVTMVFDASGHRLASPHQFNKPDIVGPDAVHTATFSTAGNNHVFTGTSAAVAHIAGNAALLRQQQTPASNYWQTVLTIDHKAIDIGPSGWDPTTGYGLDPLSGSSWTPIGPAPVNGGQTAGNLPVSGRIAGIASDPTNANIIYIAAAGGGVWKTTDGGASWTPLTDGQPIEFMGAIAVAPTSSTTIYAGTGESNLSGDSYYGLGILKSTDGGTTWTLENNNGNFTRKTTMKIVVSPSDPNTVYAEINDYGVNGTFSTGAADATGVYKSTDGGATWTNTTSGIANVNGDTFFSDLIIDPTNANRLFMAIGDEFNQSANGVYVTTDGGTTWNPAGNYPTGQDGVIRLAMSPSNTQVLYASAADTSGNLSTIKTSTDGGTTWNDVANLPPNYLGGQGDYDQTIIVSPTDPNTVFVGGATDDTTDSNGNFLNSVLETTDGGNTWTDITIGADGNGIHVDNHAMVFDAANKLLLGNDGGAWRLENPATNAIMWSDLNTNLATIQFTGVALHPTTQSIAYGGSQDNGTEKYTGAQAWQHVQAGDGGFVRVDYNNPNTVYHTFFRVTGSTSFIERSDDGGATWNDISAGINSTDQSEFYPPYVMDQNNPARLALGTDRVYITTNKGATWTAISAPNTNGWTSSQPITWVALAKSDPNTVYATTEGADIFVTHNLGASWTQIDIPNITDSFSELVVDPTNANIVYASRDQFGQGHVFKTTNGGPTWTDISGNLPDMPFRTIALDPAINTLFAGTDTGVYATADGGTSWAAFGTGLPHAQVVDLEINTTLGILGAGTHGRSMWEIAITASGGGGGGGGGGGLNLSGDQFELNDTSDVATDFGVLSSTDTFTGLTIVNHASGLQDFDWYKWQMGKSGTLTTTINSIQAGGGDLWIRLYKKVGNVLVPVGFSTQIGGVSSQSSTVSCAAGDEMYLYVSGFNHAQGSYNMQASLQ